MLFSLLKVEYKLGLVTFRETENAKETSKIYLEIMLHNEITVMILTSLVILVLIY